MTDLEPYYARIPIEKLPPVERRPIYVVLDNIRSAFNAGSIFRTADAGGVKHIYTCGMTACPPNEKLAKTALGATDYVSWSQHGRSMEAVEALRGRNIPVVAIEVTPAAVAHTTFDWPEPVGIVFGHEVRGVAPDILEAADHAVAIPMRGYKNTINVATAFGIILYEILRRWRAV